MATITRVQHVQYDEVSMLAVEGKGTDWFQSSGAPEPVRPIGAVFSGRIRITKSSNRNGYFIVRLDSKPGTDRRRVFFRGDAQVRMGGEVVTMADYYAMLVAHERLSALLGL